MSTTTRIVMNVAGYNAYRNNASVTALILALCDEVRDTAQENLNTDPPSGDDDQLEEEPDYKTEIKHGKSRVRGYVSTMTFRAMLSEQYQRPLNRAVQAH